MKSKIVIFGASGQIGKSLIRKLTKSNYRVVEITRNIHQKGYVLKTQSNSVSQWTSLPYASAPAGQWTHLAATYDGSKLRLYKNGALAEEKNISGSIVWADNPGDLYIGSFNKGDLDYYFSGHIDEVRLWNTPR